ncbi:hypothetical protein BGO17_01055 [Candidatus Saccharibacteria bacterium 49-20]|nr:MAG: hypothetical protein BGO17_01055 [Candidatus Saccharibacteria bacterium 49-20]
MRHPIHHKRNIKKLSTKKYGPIDTLALLVGIVQPFATLPQIWLVYSTGDVASVSFFMWTAYNIASVILLLYGLKYKLPPIIWANILWLVVQTPMMIAVFVFPGGSWLS